MKRVVKKKRPKRFAGILVLVIATLFICAFFYKQKADKEAEYKALLEEEHRLDILIADEKARAEGVEEYSAYVQTKSYIEEVARDVLGLVYKNEVIFRVAD